MSFVTSLVKPVVAPFRPRLKPSFLLVGAQKAGTSALFKILASHPQVVPPSVKELHFFDGDERYDRGPAWYFKQFPLVPWRDGDRYQTFEATPCYLYDERAPERIAGLLPGIKVIMVLRDPVKRAYSAWNMRRQFKDHPLHGHRHDPRSFEEAVQACLMIGPGQDFRNDLLARGDYAPQVERFFHFFGRDRCLILSYRDFLTCPDAILEEISEHVGLSAYSWPQELLLRKENKRRYSNSMSDELRNMLYGYYSEKLKNLDILLGRKMMLEEDWIKGSTPAISIQKSHEK